jgi:hypothetical protein
MCNDIREAGMTKTLYEKLKDRDFRKRFSGWLLPPVSKEEIEDRYDEITGKFIEPVIGAKE